MDVRNWDFLDKRLAELGSISRELSGSGFAAKIAYTAFFWTLLQYHQSQDEAGFHKGAMSLPDHLTPENLARIERISHELDAWMATQDPAAHPRFADLRAAVDLGLQATSHPLFEPRRYEP